MTTAPVAVSTPSVERSAEPNHDAETKVREMVGRFRAWLVRVGYESFDPYDIWGTRYGVWSRRLYYAKHPLGVPLIAPLLALEIVCPSVRALIVKKDRYPTADAQLALAFLNLARLDGDADALARARTLAADLLKTAVPGFAGMGWGYPFDWMNNRGLWRKNTPYITATPYCYEVFSQLHELTGEAAYREHALSAARFVHDTLQDTPTSRDAAASSYSPSDDSRVVNASAYRAFVLFDAARRFGLDHYVAKARGNLNFILQNQREDGAWLYGIDCEKQKFIDHFHTCFVLKNLFKLNRDLRDPTVDLSIARGYQYYRRELFGPDDHPKSFSVEPRTQLARLEMYNIAEAITLGCLLRDSEPDAFPLALRLAARTRERYQLPAGHFITREFRGGLRHTFPFLRWPQSQVFYALTNLLVELAARQPHPSERSPAVSRVEP